jgi:hypothetical protein
MAIRKSLLAALVAIALASSCTGGGTTGQPSASPQKEATGSPLPPVGDWWAGEITAVSTFESPDGSTTCTEVWDVDMDLYDNKGQVTGNGNGDLLAQRACRSDDPDFDVKSQAEHFDFNLRGKFSNKRFTIQLIVTSSNGDFLGRLDQSLFYQGTDQQPRSLAIPITQPGVAQARLQIEEDVPRQGTVTGSHRFLFACQQC